MTERIKSLIANLKHHAGVYLMHDKNDTIIYVGKAKDLQKRVSQYFLRPQAGKVFKMVTEVEYFETILCANEKEAFVLEMNLIHKHYPKFNILLKDGSHYPYIALKKEGHPFLMSKRNNKDKSFDYFGPFPNAGACWEMIDLLNKIFPIRKCQTLQTRPCLYYHMGQCIAPCVNKIDEETDNKLREDIKSFMRGNNTSIRSDLFKKMKEASDNLEFEAAGRYKSIIDAIDHINTAQNVEMNDKKDRDLFAFSTREGYLSLAVLLFRKGVLLDKKVYVVESFDDQYEQVSDLIIQFYENIATPSEVVINSDEVISSLENILDCGVIKATKGKLYDLLVSAKQNADNALDEYFISARLDDDKLALLEELGNILHIDTPLHIELFDNSHLQGSSPVGAMVAFINGEKAKNLYRKFKIEHEEARDDIKSMKEIIYRHYKRSVAEKKKLPDLVLVDGGLTQIKAAKEALDNIPASINLFGLYKNDKHQTAGLMDIEGNTYPIDNRAIFFLLTRMQDEVHRFAINFHKEKRNKAMTSSLLDDVQGLGDKRKEVIRQTYGDINSLKEASLEELSQLLPDEVALTLYNKIHFNIKK